MKLIPLFSPQRYLQKTDDVSQLSTGRGKRQWIIARALCYYRCFDLNNVPASERDSALQLQITQWSPLSDYDIYRVWKKSQVQVWIWDRTQQQTAMQQAGLKQAQCIPESVLRPAQQNGLHVLQCAEGIEAQIWADHNLKHSRWWATPPNLQTWQRFQRSHRLPLSHEVSPAHPHNWLEKPWGRHKAPLRHSAFLQEKLWITLAGVFFMAALGWQSVMLWKWQQAVEQVQQQSEQLDEQVNPILDQRQIALAEQQRIKHIQRLKRHPEVLVLMQLVADKLPQYAHLVGWSYQTGKLNFTIRAKSIDPRYYVSSFEKISHFKNVKTENGNSQLQLTIKMDVLSLPTS